MTTGTEGWLSRTPVPEDTGGVVETVPLAAVFVVVMFALVLVGIDAVPPFNC